MRAKNLFVVGFLFYFLLIVKFTAGQNYLFFNPYSKKLFTTFPSASSTYSIAFDSVRFRGTDTIYYNFFGVNDTTIRSDSCSFWGSPDCIAQDYPSWIGNKVEHAVSGIYRFYNNNSDTLAINTNLAVGDTALFFKDNNQRFFLIYDYSDTITFLNNIDSAKYFRVWHTDVNGIPINSSLHQKKIVVAKQWGLVNFFRVDSFPIILQPLQLIGNISPDGGMTKITNEMIYDYLPGDEIQFKIVSYCFSYPPWWNHIYYDKLVFLSRKDTLDSLIYSVEEHYFADTSAYEKIDTIQMKYYKYDVIDSIPFEFFDGRERSLEYKSFCNQNFWTYRSYRPNNRGYCPKENCWGSIDIFGDPFSYRDVYVFGVGHYVNEIFPIPAQWCPYISNDIIYFKKNGIACGMEAFVGIDEISQTNHNILIYPNPAVAGDEITISNMPFPMEKIEVFNVMGARVYHDGHTEWSRSVNNGASTTLSLTDVVPGIYFIQVSDGERIYSGKVVVEK